VTYFSGKGYFIDAINEARSTYSVDKSYWQLRSDLEIPDKGKVQYKHSFFMLYSLYNLSRAMTKPT
jgi:hypothetical protein